MPEETSQYFAVVIERDGSAVLEERLTGGDGDVRVAPKAKLDDYTWSRVSGPAAMTFNQRLRRAGQKAATWNKLETVLGPQYGRELALLFWAVEGADPTLLPAMIANWNGLAPEERWWLYSTINATSRHPEHDRDRGWRKAIKIAFAENPVSGPPPESLLSGPMPLYETRKPKGKAGRSKGAAGAAGAAAQGTMAFEFRERPAEYLIALNRQDQEDE